MRASTPGSGPRRHGAAEGPSGVTRGLREMNEPNNNKNSAEKKKWASQPETRQAMTLEEPRSVRLCHGT